MVYGYVRVSTLRQKVTRQVDNIKAIYPDALIVEEKFTGTSISRPQFDKLLNRLHSGDKICFDSVSRMSRTSREGFELYMNLYNKGINLEFIKEPMINTDIFRQTAQLAMTGTDVDVVLDGINKYLMILAEKQIEIAFNQAEKEVKDLHARISEGLRQTQLNGTHVGREKGKEYQTKKSDEMKIKMRELSKDFEGTLTDKKVMEYTGLARNTYYKYKKQLLSELAE